MYRVLQVVTHMNRGGLESMLMNYYRHIDREKLQFDFLTHREYDGDYGEEIKELGGIIYHLPTLNPFSRSYKQALHDFFQTHPEYQIIHVHQDCLSGVVLREAAHHKIPVRIAHSHSSRQDRDWKYPIKLFYRHLIPRYATDLLACSEEAGRWMFCAAEFQILNNAIDAKKYRFSRNTRQFMREKLGIDSDCLVVGHVGRFDAVKNHAKIVDIFKILLDGRKAVLLLVGDGELKLLIKQKVNKLGLEERVIFTGVRSDVSELMQAMDVFVFPSLYEGLPVTLVEAQAAGLPCLISDHVPTECKLTSAVWRLPLEASSETWAKQAIEAVKEPRRDTFEEIQAAGYDIDSNTERLQRFYLNGLNNML